MDFIYTPRSRSEARRWNVLNSQDMFYKIREWPLVFQKMGVKDDLKHDERWKLYLFLVMNGLHPERAKEVLYLYRNVDRSFVSQLQAIDAGMDRYRLYRYYDMTERRYI